MDNACEGSTVPVRRSAKSKCHKNESSPGTSMIMPQQHTAKVCVIGKKTEYSRGRSYNLRIELNRKPLLQLSWLSGKSQPN